jgi:hypothetical protein
MPVKDGESIIEVGEPTGPGSDWFTGKMQVKIGRRYGKEHSEYQSFLLTLEELETLFIAIGNRLIGSDQWGIRFEKGE